MKRAPYLRQGFTLLELLIVVALIAVLATIAIPNLLQSRESANESSAIGALKELNTAESTYRVKFGVFGTLPNMQSAGLVDPVVGGASSSANPKSGYYFTFNSVSSTQYYINANPLAGAGSRAFYTDESGVVMSNSSPSATASSDLAGAPGQGFGSVGQ